MAYDGRIKVEVGSDAYAIDIPTMRDLPAREYLGYVEGELFFIDHHDVLRCSFSEHPIAATKEQYQLLSNYLLRAMQRFDL